MTQVYSKCISPFQTQAPVRLALHRNHQPTLNTGSLSLTKQGPVPIFKLKIKRGVGSVNYISAIKFY